ncbi:MAG: NUDIX hydrolase [Pseudomonadota bacterium]
MTEKNGPWTIRGRREVYQNPWITLDHHDVIDANGDDGVYGVVRFANLAIGILPLFEDGTVPLVGQHRFTFDAFSWELPEGGGAKDVPPEDTARRELAEETGLRAKNWHHLGESHISNSVTDEVAHYFLAWDLIQGELSPDGCEVFSHRRVPFSTLVAECMEGKISDCLTLLMVQTAILKAQSELLPPRPTDIILGQYEKSL